MFVFFCNFRHHILELVEVQEAILIIVYFFNGEKPGVIIEFTKDFSKIFDGNLSARLFVEEVKSLLQLLF
jgi:hypothetical protein